MAAVVVVWSTLLAASALARFDLLGEDPLSYLGTQPRSRVLFTVGLAVPALLLTAFHHFLRRRFPVSFGFSVVMLAGLAGQMVAAFVPIGGDNAVHRVHTVSALVLGASLPMLMWRFAASQPRGPWRRLTYTLFWAELAACVVGIYLSALAIAPLAEILPGAVFHAWIITVTLAVTARLEPNPGHRSTYIVSGGRTPCSSMLAATSGGGDARFAIISAGSGTSADYRHCVAAIRPHMVHHVAASQRADGVGPLGLELQPLVHVDDVMGDDELGHPNSFGGSAVITGETSF